MRRLFFTLSYDQLAARLGKSVCAVKSKANKIGLVKVRRWTDAELSVLKDQYGWINSETVARNLNRPLKHIYNQATALGLTKTYHRVTAAEKRTIKRMVKAGACNTHIGQAIGIDKHIVRKWRTRLGLPQLTSGGSVDSCQACKERVRANTKEQCRKAGVKSLAEIRTLAFRKYARKHGWSEDIRPRGVQILNLLFMEGPKTRFEIAGKIGLRWRGSRKSLCSNDPQGSYLANLLHRGLVVVIKRGRQVTGQGKGHSVDLYAIPLGVKPRKGNEHEHREELANPPQRRSRSRCRNRLAV